MSGLMKCKGCGAEISENAKACPHCGEPVPKKTSLFTWLVLILIILGIISSMRDTPSTVPKASTPASSIVTAKQSTQAETEQRKKTKEQDIEYFKQSKEVIVEDIKLEIQNKNYHKAVALSSKYLQFKGRDEDIIKVNQDARELLTKDFKEKQAQKVAKTKIEDIGKILKKLKTIPTSDFNQNMELYETLLSYEPDNKKYKEKVKFYTTKANEAEAKEEKERADRIAKFGKPPTQSAWDGGYYVVENYLKRVANDPDSIEVSGCTKLRRNKDGWLVGCDYRGKNEFGGLIRQSNWFTIRHDKVIRVDDASAY